MTAPLAIGLDFGTSNSTIAAMTGNTPRLALLEGESRTIPTAVYFDFRSGTPSYGRAAIAAYTKGGNGRLMRSLKSVLGSDLMSEATPVGRKRMAFADIIASFIGEIKARAETEFGSAIESVVLGRPVHFVDDDAVADREAQDVLEAVARKIGFRDVSFQLEPIAAALEFERGLTHEALALIADIGGGTADFTVARLSPDARDDRRESDILANHGVHIGGTDLDRLLSMDQVMPLLGLGSGSLGSDLNLPVWPFIDLSTWHRINILRRPDVVESLKAIERGAAQPDLFGRFMGVVESHLGHALASRVEAAKVRLSEEPRFSAEIPEIDDKIAVTFDKACFEAAILSPMDSLQKSAAEALAIAGVSASDIDVIFMTGGTTAVPLVHRTLCQIAPTAKVQMGDAFGSVGLGLAIEAHRRYR